MRGALAGVLLVVALIAAACGGGKVASAQPAHHGGYDGLGDNATIRIASGTPRVGSSTSAGALSGAADVARLLDGIPQNGLVLGEPNAPVTLIEYIDLQCPLCRDFETTELAPLVEKYVRPGKLKIEMRPWTILDAPGGHDSARGQKATIAAAAQNKAFDFALVLYDNQGGEGSGWLDDATLSNIAASVDGLDPYRLASDGESAATRQVIASVNSWASSHATQMVGTPTFYLAQGSGAPRYLLTGVPELSSLEAAIQTLVKTPPRVGGSSG
jgi:protein-disulfide isomerase